MTGGCKGMVYAAVDFNPHPHMEDDLAKPRRVKLAGNFNPHPHMEDDMMFAL